MDAAPPLRIEGLEPALAPGEVLALLGEGGEESLLALAGFAPTEGRGRAWLGAQELGPLPPHRRGLGFVPDPPGLLPGRTVAENIAWPLRCGRAEQAQRVARALAALGLTALAERRAATLAPAEAMRVAIARALATQPPVLVLQNPFAGADGPGREALALRLRGLGLPVVLATTDAAAAMAAADRIGVLAGGVLRQCGTPREVYERPVSPAVAALTGPANWLPGLVEQAWEDEARLRLDAGVTVEALLAAPLPAGARCRLLVRPERLAVAAMPPEAMGEGALGATLREARLLGAQVRLRLALADGTELVALRPAGLRLPAHGEFCALAWDAGAGLAFGA